MRNVRTIIAALATLALAAGTATAGDPKAAPAAAPAAKAAPAAAPTATAQAPAPAKPAAATPAPAAKAAPAPAPAKPAAAPAAGKDVKAAPAPGAAPAKPAEPAAAEPPMPQPAPELAAAAKASSGTWRCKGNVYGPDGTARPSTGVSKTKVDLDKFWITTSFAETTGKNKFKFTTYRTFDPASKKWTSIMVDNWGGYQVSTSTDGVTWEGTSNSPMGVVKAKDTETLVSPKEQHLVGQYSKDNGKTWVNGYDVTCKK
jgi:hypothetical protein